MREDQFNGLVFPRLHKTLDELQDLHKFVHLCDSSLAMASEADVMADIVERVLRLFPSRHGLPNPEEEKPRLDAMKSQMKSLAMESKRFVDAGIPHLFRMASVWLWAILEGSIDAACSDYVQFHATRGTLPVLAEIKGPLIEFAAAPEEARARMLLDSLKLQVKAPLKVGVGRFEEILSALGLGAAVEPDVRRMLLELSETRNVIVHRASVIDSSFICACPWLGATAGEVLTVNRRKYLAFYFAVNCYFVELIDRFGRPAPDDDDKESLDDLHAQFLRYMRQCMDDEQEKPNLTGSGANG